MAYMIASIPFWVSGFFMVIAAFHAMNVRVAVDPGPVIHFKAFLHTLAIAAALLLFSAWLCS